MSTPHMSALTVTALHRTGHTEQDQFFELKLARDASSADDAKWEGWKPGQFAMLRPAGWALDMPWARPLSLCQVTDDALCFFFQVAGRGTARMAELVPGDVVHIWGPLGSGFAVEPETPTLLLAGGIGIAPFVGYALGHPHGDQLHMMFGHRAAAEVYPLQTLRAAGVHVANYPECAPEDREHFLQHIRARMAALGTNAAAQTGLVLACGPEPFLRYVQRVALECGVRAQVSLETRMACGVGACLGCVVTPTEKNTMAGAAGLPQRTCVNGPVFWADQVVIG